MSLVIPIVIILAVIGLPLVSIAAVVMLLRKSGQARFDLDFASIYYHVVALITLLIAGAALFALVNSILNLSLGTWRPDLEIKPAGPPGYEVPVMPEPQDRWVKQQIASTGAMFILVTPVWLYHWAKARKQALKTRGFFIHKMYLYLVVVIALIAFLTAGGVLLSKLIEFPLGNIDLSVERSRNEFYRDSISSLFNMLVAGAVWLYHWRAIGKLPSEMAEEEITQS